MEKVVNCPIHGEEPAMEMKIGTYYKKIVCVMCYFSFIADNMINFDEDQVIEK